MQQSYVVSGCSCSLIHFRYFRPEFGPTRPLTNLVTVALPVCSVSLHQSEYLPDMKLESGRAGLENTPFFSLVPLFKYVSYSFWHLYFKKVITVSSKPWVPRNPTRKCHHVSPYFPCVFHQALMTQSKTESCSQVSWACHCF